MYQGLEGKSIGSKNIKVADVIPRSFENKEKQGVVLPPRETLDDEAEENPVSDGLRNDCSNNNTPALGGSSTRARSARDVVTPLAHMSYVDQLVHKVNALMQMLKKLVSFMSIAMLFYPLISVCILCCPFSLGEIKAISNFVRPETHAKLVLVVFHFQIGFSSRKKEVTVLLSKMITTSST